MFVLRAVTRSWRLIRATASTAIGGVQTGGAPTNRGIAICGLKTRGTLTNLGRIALATANGGVKSRGAPTNLGRVAPTAIGGMKSCGATTNRGTVGGFVMIIGRGDGKTTPRRRQVRPWNSSQQV